MYLRALEVQTRLEDAGAERVVTDVRNAQPPCMLLTPPEHVYDLACGATLKWTVVLLAPPPGNADAWRALDAMLTVVEDALDIENARPGMYVLAAGVDPLPAMFCTFSETR